MDHDVENPSSTTVRRLSATAATLVPYNAMLLKEASAKRKLDDYEAMHLKGVSAKAVPELRRLDKLIAQLLAHSSQSQIKSEDDRCSLLTPLQKQSEYDALCTLNLNLQAWLERREQADAAPVEIGYERGRARLAETVMDVVDSWIEVLNEVRVCEERSDELRRRVCFDVDLFLTP